MGARPGVPVAGALWSGGRGAGHQMRGAARPGVWKSSCRAQGPSVVLSTDGTWWPSMRMTLHILVGGP